jgi:DNA polymerase-3 subunit chi
MSQVAFHLDAPDKAVYTCRLLRKAAGLGTKVLVTGERIELDQLDGTLWCFAPREFVPHCRSDAPAEVLQRSAVILASPGLPAGRRHDGAGPSWWAFGDRSGTV